MTRRHGRAAPPRGSPPRTAPVNLPRPTRRTRTRSPAHRATATATAARQQADQNGAPDPAKTARPGTPQQAPDLVHLPGGINGQPIAAGAPAPQPRPDRNRPPGLTAA